MAWLVVPSVRAQADLTKLLRWTAGQFGRDQMERYAGAVGTTLIGLRRGPYTIGARARPELALGVWSIRVALARRRASHVMLFTLDPAATPQTVTVIRILHHAMDPARHLPDDDAPP